MPVVSLPESNGGGVVLTRSKVLCVGKKLYHNPEFFTYAGTNEYVLANEEELTKAPWPTMTVIPNLRGKALSMKFARSFVKLSERATHVKDIQWSDDLVTPRLSWLCKYLPKVWVASTTRCSCSSVDTLFSPRQMRVRVKLCALSRCIIIKVM